MALENLVEDKTIANKTGKNGFGLGLAGTIAGGLALLGGGGNGLSGILGGNTNGSNTNSDYVDKDQFYQTTMSQNDRIWGVVVDQQKAQADTNLAMCQRISGLEASLAVANTANDYQNKIMELSMNYENQLTKCYIGGQNFVRATPMLSPAQIGVGYMADTRVLESYPAYPDPYRNRGYDGVSCCG